MRRNVKETYDGEPPVKLVAEESEGVQRNFVVVCDGDDIEYFEPDEARDAMAWTEGFAFAAQRLHRPEMSITRVLVYRLRQLTRIFRQ